MRGRAAFRVVLAVPVLVLAGCMGDETATVEPPPQSVPTLADAAERTVAAGPARITAKVQAPRARYLLRGSWDPTVGYRVRARIEQARVDYARGHVLWLEGVNRSYGTLIGFGRGGNGTWLDDHPPTLPLFGLDRDSLGTPPGAEDYLHAALLALGGMTDSGRIDFRRFDRDPPRRDEDGWTLRPLLRKLGTRRVRGTVDGDGFLTRLGLRAPRHVRVDLRLAGFGEAPRVRHVVAYAIE